MKRRRSCPLIETGLSAFAGFRFPPEVIVLAVRWYLRFDLSYRDLEELLAERGIEADHVTLFRWVHRFTPLLIDAARPCRHAVGNRWFVDETDVKVSGVWRYVYRAVDQHGQVIDGIGSHYSGQGAWAPIMGAGYDHPVTQWSQGEYTDANNQEDELAMIATGAPVRADDHGDTLATAAVLSPAPHQTAGGMIATRADKDMFQFQASGLTTITVNPAPVGPNLDIRADLLTVNGTPITFSNPPVLDGTNPTATGLNASITQTLPAGSYDLQIDGVGQGATRSPPATACRCRKCDRGRVWSSDAEPCSASSPRPARR